MLDRPERREVTAAMLAEAVNAWAAFRVPDPVGLAVCQPSLEQLPFLAAALERLLEKSPPGVADGLSRTERLTLQAVADGAGSPFACSSPRRISRRRRSSATRGSIGRSPRSAKATTWLLETEDGEPVAPPPLSDAEHARLSLRVTLRQENGF